MLQNTFTLIAATIVCIIGCSQSFPKMDFSDVILRTRAKKNTEVADLAEKIHRFNIRLNETVHELDLTNGKTVFIETRITVAESKVNDTEKRLSQSQSETSQMLTNMEGTIADIQNNVLSAVAEVLALKSDVEIALSNNLVKGKLVKVQGDMATINNELQEMKNFKVDIENKLVVFSDDTANVKEVLKTLLQSKQDIERKLNTSIKEVEILNKEVDTKLSDDRGQTENIKKEIKKLKKSTTVLDHRVDGLTKDTINIKDNMLLFDRSNREMKIALDAAMEEITNAKKEPQLVVQTNEQLKNRMTAFQASLSTFQNVSIKTQGKLQNSVNALEKKMEKMATKLEILGKGALCRQHPGFVYDESTNMCWRLFPSRLSNPSAKIECSKHGAHGRLVIQDTTEKHNVVKAYIRREGFTQTVHVDGNNNSGGGLVWTNGRVMGGVQWFPREPWVLKCVTLWTERGLCFDDISCTSKYSYICEIPMV